MNKPETFDCLTRAGIPYEITEHPAVCNMAEMAQIEIPYPETDAKNLFVRDDKKRSYYLITVRGDKRVDLKKFRKQQGMRPLSFASAEDLAALLELAPGAVTPLGLLNDEDRRVQLYLDAEFLEAPELVGVHPNDNSATVWLRPRDLIRILEEHGSTVRVVPL